jgi:hypothetical protein
LARDLAQRRRSDDPGRCSLTLAVYLTQRWLPSKQLTLRAIVEIHMILRHALDDAVRRGLLVSNELRIAHAPKRPGKRHDQGASFR